MDLSLREYLPEHLGQPGRRLLRYGEFLDLTSDKIPGVFPIVIVAKLIREVVIFNISRKTIRRIVVYL